MCNNFWSFLSKKGRPVRRGPRLGLGHLDMPSCLWLLFRVRFCCRGWRQHPRTTAVHRSPSGVPVFLCPTNHCSVEVSWTSRREKMLGRRHHLELVFSGWVRSGDGEKRSSKRLFNPLTGLSKNSFSGSLNRNGFEVPFNF
jgi:hypothetical protein